MNIHRISISTYTIDIYHRIATLSDSNRSLPTRPPNVKPLRDLRWALLRSDGRWNKSWMGRVFPS